MKHFGSICVLIIGGNASHCLAFYILEEMMRKIKQGETAEIGLDWVKDYGLFAPHFFIGGEEVTVPHNTVFQAFQQGKELLFTYVECLEPQEALKIPLMFKEMYKKPVYFGRAEEAELDNDKVTAIMVP